MLHGADTESMFPDPCISGQGFVSDVKFLLSSQYEVLSKLIALSAQLVLCWFGAQRRRAVYSVSAECMLSVLCRSR